ncbi:MAG: SDR family NAD(P)-dependent oxidoreductase [bacterium]|nr:SDR family NAD(P)-dependent oxidoreductase [bacterium]
MQKNAIVTGGSKGIGLAIVEKLLNENYKVFTVSRSEGELALLKQKFDTQLDISLLDFSSQENVEIFSKKVKSLTSEIDVLVNNAGVFLPGTIHGEADGNFELQMQLNVAAPYYLTRAIVPLMIKKRAGYIFNMCSTASIVPYVNGGSYCISKHALLGFSKVLRQELMPYEISVSSILPGATLTDSWSGTDLPENRFMKPADIAETVWFALSNRKRMVMEEILIRPMGGDL